MDWTALLLLLAYVYSVNNLLLLVYSLNLLALLVLSLWPARPDPAPALPAEWPTVLVQLPVYNERYVVERIIDSAANLDYPRNKLHIQVLDDSTDDTAQIAESRVALHCARSVPICYHYRAARKGYKAGALSEGMVLADSEYVAIFDADFQPSPGFLKRLIPRLCANPRLGFLQARWDHLNPRHNLVTAAIALGLDAFFAVEQVARNRGRLFMNFNGSAGIWRRKCIQESGGWQGDTLVEDTDLSFRAQFLGWQAGYANVVAVPAQLPETILALKLQQFRWSKGSIQTLLKLGGAISRSNKPWTAKVEGFMQLSGYVVQPLMMFSLLLSLPVVLLHGQVPLGWAPLGLASLIPPLFSLTGQVRLRRSLKTFPLSFLLLLLAGIGLAVSNMRAMAEAVRGRESEFRRTPKVSPEGPRPKEYRLTRDWTIALEMACAVYGLVTAYLAWSLAPGFVPFILLYALGFSFTAVSGLVQKA